MYLSLDIFHVGIRLVFAQGCGDNLVLLSVLDSITLVHRTLENLFLPQFYFLHLILQRGNNFKSRGRDFVLLLEGKVALGVLVADGEFFHIVSDSGPPPPRRPSL